MISRISFFGREGHKATPLLIVLLVFVNSILAVSGTGLEPVSQTHETIGMTSNRQNQAVSLGTNEATGPFDTTGVSSGDGSSVQREGGPNSGYLIGRDANGYYFVDINKPEDQLPISALNERAIRSGHQFEALKSSLDHSQTQTIDWGRLRQEDRGGPATQSPPSSPKYEGWRLSNNDHDVPLPEALGEWRPVAVGSEEANSNPLRDISPAFGPTTAQSSIASTSEHGPEATGTHGLVYDVEVAGVEPQFWRSTGLMVGRPGGQLDPLHLPPKSWQRIKAESAGTVDFWKPKFLQLQTDGRGNFRLHPFPPPPLTWVQLDPSEIPAEGLRSGIGSSRGRWWSNWSAKVKNVFSRSARTSATVDGAAGRAQGATSRRQSFTSAFDKLKTIKNKFASLFKTDPALLQAGAHPLHRRRL